MFSPCPVCGRENCCSCHPGAAAGGRISALATQLGMYPENPKQRMTPRQYVNAQKAQAAALFKRAPATVSQALPLPFERTFMTESGAGSSGWGEFEVVFDRPVLLKNLSIDSMMIGRDWAPFDILSVKYGRDEIMRGAAPNTRLWSLTPTRYDPARGLSLRVILQVNAPAGKQVAVRGQFNSSDQMTASGRPLAVTTRGRMGG